MAQGFVVSGELVDDQEHRISYDVYQQSEPAVTKRGIITFAALDILDTGRLLDPLQVFQAHRAQIANKSGDVWLANLENEHVILDASDF